MIRTLTVNLSMILALSTSHVVYAGSFFKPTNSDLPSTKETAPVKETVTDKQVAPAKEVPSSKETTSINETPSAKETVPTKEITPGYLIPNDKVVAEFPNGEKIYFEHVIKIQQNLPAQSKVIPLEKIYKPIVERLKDAKLLLDAARKVGIDKDPIVLKRITDGLEALVQKAYLDKEIDKLVTADILQAKYQELLKLIPKDEIEVRISHILLKTKQEAEEVIKALKTGKKFEELVAEKSTDDKTKDRKGDLDFIRRNDVPKEASDVIFKTAKGAIVTEPIKLIETGYSVIRIEDKRPVEPPSFELVKDDIKKAVAPEFAVKVMEKIRQEEKVKLFGLDGKPLVEKTVDEKKSDTEKELNSTDISKIDEKMVVAEFKNGEKYTFAQVKDSIKSLPPQLQETFNSKINDETYKALLLRLTDMKSISSRSREAGIDKDPAMLKRFDEARDAIIQKFYLDREISKMISPEMVKVKYEELLKLMPKNEIEVRLKHILVKTKKEADDVMKSLKTGTKFDDLVKTKSLDKQTKESNGDLGYVPKSELPKEFGEAVIKVAKGTLLPEPVNLGELGYSIVRVEDKRPIEPPKMEEAQGEIIKILSRELSTKIIENLRKETPVKIIEWQDLSAAYIVPTPNKLSDGPASKLETKKVDIPAGIKTEIPAQPTAPAA